MGASSIAAIALATCALAVTTAHAQSAPPSPALPPPGPAVSPRSPGVGVGLALAGTIIPVIGFGVGLSLEDNDAQEKTVLISLAAGTLLPAAGLAYGGSKASYGFPVRVGAVLTLGVAALADGLGADDDASTWYGVAGLLYVVGSGIDIALTPKTVRDWNTRHGAGIAVAPIAVPSGGGIGLAGTW